MERPGDGEEEVAHDQEEARRGEDKALSQRNGLDGKKMVRDERRIAWGEQNMLVFVHGHHRENSRTAAMFTDIFTNKGE